MSEYIFFYSFFCFFFAHYLDFFFKCLFRQGQKWLVSQLWVLWPLTFDLCRCAAQILFFLPSLQFQVWMFCVHESKKVARFHSISFYSGFVFFLFFCFVHIKEEAIIVFRSFVRSLGDDLSGERRSISQNVRLVLVFCYKMRKNFYIKMLFLRSLSHFPLHCSRVGVGPRLAS